MQDPTPQCCCTQLSRPTTRKTPSPEQLNARGPRHFRRWTPLSRARGPDPPLSTPLPCAGTSNPPHGTTHRTRLRNCRRGSKKKCPAPGTWTKPPDHRRGSKSSRFFPPHTKTPPASQKTEKVTHAVFRRCTAPVGSAALNKPPRSAAGQAITGCSRRKRRPSTLSHTALRLPRNTRRRGTLQAAEQLPEMTFGHQQGSRHLGVR
mgnify:CR=1 FL=1